jgi:hypothetical protein
MNMKGPVKLLSAIVLLFIASAAQATVIRYTLENVVLDDGGTASGYFDWDTTLPDAVPEYQGSSVNYEISISGGDEVTFPPFVYSDEVAGEVSSGGSISGTRILQFGEAGSPPNRLITLIPDATAGVIGQDLDIPLVISPDNSIEIVNVSTFEVREFSSGSLRGQVISQPARAIPADAWWALVLLAGLLALAGIRSARA